MAAFIRKTEGARPNAKKSVRKIQAKDILYLDQQPCLMADPPNIACLDGLSGAGYEDPRDEKMLLVRGRSVIDGEEYSQLYGLNAAVEYFVDRHDEREWLVVCICPVCLPVCPRLTGSGSG